MNREAGQQFGCRDTGSPQNHTPAQLSRVLDILDNAEALGGKDLKQAVWEVIPHSMRTEFNYARWCYVPGRLMTAR